MVLTGAVLLGMLAYPFGAEAADTLVTIVGPGVTKQSKGAQVENGTLLVGDGAGALTINGGVKVSNGKAPLAVAGNVGVGDGDGPLTIDGTVGVTDADGPLTVDGSVGVSGSVGVIGSVPVSDGAEPLTVDAAALPERPFTSHVGTGFGVSTVKLFGAQPATTAFGLTSLTVYNNDSAREFFTVWVYPDCGTFPDGPITIVWDYPVEGGQAIHVTFPTPLVLGYSANGWCAGVNSPSQMTVTTVGFFAPVA